MRNRADRAEEADNFTQHYEVYSLGDAAFRKGCFSEAKNYFKIALEYCPDDCDSWLALGNCHDAMKQPRKAEECFRQALFFADEDAKSEILFSLGNSLYDQEKYEKALETYLQIPKGTTVWHRVSRYIVLAKQMLKPVNPIDRAIRKPR